MSQTEQHPLFPSGDWTGFYTYASGPTAVKHPMDCRLQFIDGRVSGEGVDDVAAFRWTGTYDTALLTCKLVKQYLGRHAVSYDGQVDENGIWGNWHLENFTGGFHIKPRDPGAEESEIAAAKEVKKKVGAAGA